MTRSPVFSPNETCAKSVLSPQDTDANLTHKACGVRLRSPCTHGARSLQLRSRPVRLHDRVGRAWHCEQVTDGSAPSGDVDSIPEPGLPQARPYARHTCQRRALRSRVCSHCLQPSSADEQDDRPIDRSRTCGNGGPDCSSARSCLQVHYASAAGSSETTSRHPLPPIRTTIEGATPLSSAPQTAPCVHASVPRGSHQDAFHRGSAATARFATAAMRYAARKQVPWRRGYF